MENESKPLQAKPVVHASDSSDMPYVEDPCLINEYACMYYMMTPTGCSWFSESILLDK